MTRILEMVEVMIINEKQSRQSILTHKRVIVHSDAIEAFDNLIKNS